MTRLMPLLLLVSACATPTLHPSQISVKEIEYGVYSVSNGEDVLVDVTNQIPCRGDAKFGIRVRLTFPDDRTVRIPVAGEIREPEILGVRPSSQATPSEPMTLPKGISSIVIAVMDEFKGNFDLVDGDYEVRLIHPETGLAYHSRKFVLRNCEGSPPHNKILHQTKI